ncbi:MAG TPA: hypothetical protein VM433_11560 [Mycobacteriales bacterium]|nr:hypothetical protein [Mycobacteriales bacterium]
MPRRTVLTGGLALLAGGGLAGCTSLPGRSEPDGPPAPHPDVVLADQAALRERRLIAAYDAVMQRAPELAERLAPLRAQHAEHLAALGVPALPAPAAAPAAAAPTAEPTGPPTPAPVAPPPLPDDPAALLPALADLERRAATAHAGAAVRSGRGLAVVLASAAASEASHPLALA